MKFRKWLSTQASFLIPLTRIAICTEIINSANSMRPAESIVQKMYKDDRNDSY